MWFSLDVIPARKGDCLMLHFGTKSDPHLILIDGGPSNVYRPHLKPRIDKLRTVRNLGAQPLPVDAVLVSHVDDDHIKGILELTQELRALKLGMSPLFLRAGSLWHNSFDDLLTTTPQELQAQASFGAAALTGQIDVADNVQFDAAKVLASIPQGRDLRLDAGYLNWTINREFKGKLIMATDKPTVVPLTGGVKLTVVGPMKAEITALQKAHDKWLRDSKKKKAKPASAALAAFVDKSIPNLSSIVMLAEAQGQTMLFTGDARGDKVLKGLQLVGRLGPGKKSTLPVTLLKVPHHGSANNLAAEFFQRIPAEHYVFSGNGEHGNPERETLQMLLDARGDTGYTIHLTYPVAEIDVARQADWEKERAKEQTRKKKNSKQKVRPVWSPQKHSLAAFLAKHTSFEQTIQIVEKGKPHLIDLLDTLTI